MQKTLMWVPGVCSVDHCWIFCCCPGRNQLDIWNAHRLFLLHNDSWQRCPNCPRLPRRDILSTVMRASLRLTVADGGVYIEPWNSAACCPPTDTSVHPAYTSTHRICPLMDVRTNQHAVSKVSRSNNACVSPGWLFFKASVILGSHMRVELCSFIPAG